MFDLKVRAEVLTLMLKDHPILHVARLLNVGRNTITIMLKPLGGVEGLRRLVSEGSTIADLALLTYGNHPIPPGHVRALVELKRDPCPTCGGLGTIVRRVTAPRDAALTDGEAGHDDLVSAVGYAR